MPRVPLLTGQSVETRRLPVPTVSAEAAGMPIARALGNIAEIVEQEREKVVEIQANDALVKLRSARDAALYDPQAGVLNLQQANALDAPKAFAERWTKDVSDIAAGIKDPEARRRFERQANRDRLEAESMVLRHVDAETERLDENTTKLRSEALAQDAIAMAGLPDAELKIAERETLVRNRLARQGIVGQAADDVLRDEKSRLRLGQIEGLASQDNAEGAATLFEEYKDQLRGGDLIRAQKAVQGVQVDVQSQKESDNLLAIHGTDEKAALKAAETKFTGALRDRVVQRLEISYARQKRLRQEEVATYTNEAMNAAYAGRPIPRTTRTWLEANGQSKVLRAAQEVQKAATEGSPVQTNLKTYQELTDMLVPENREKFLSTNLLEYSNRVSRQDLKEFIDTQAALRGAQRRPGAGVSTSTVMNELFRQAQGSGMFDKAVTQFGDLEKRPEDKAVYEVLRSAVDTELANETERFKGPLSAEQARQVIRRTLDSYIIEDKGWMFKTRTAVPIGEASPDAIIRRGIQRAGGEPTSAKIEAIRLLMGRTDLTPAQKESLAEQIARGR